MIKSYKFVYPASILPQDSAIFLKFLNILLNFGLIWLVTFEFRTEFVISVVKKKSTRMGLEPTTFGSEVRRAIHYATEPHKV